MDELQALLGRIIKRIMKLLTRTGHLIEEQGMTYLAEAGSDSVLAPLQAAACTYRIALGPRAGHKVLSLQTIPADRPIPHSQAASPCTAAYTPQCVVAHISAGNSNACAGISPARRLPTNGSNAIKQAKSCSSSRVPTETGPPIS